MSKLGQQPAFPLPSSDDAIGEWDGMTLRQYYAGQAMNAVMNNSELSRLDAKDVFAMCWAAADELLKAEQEQI